MRKLQNSQKIKQEQEKMTKYVPYIRFPATHMQNRLIVFSHPMLSRMTGLSTYHMKQETGRILEIKSRERDKKDRNEDKVRFSSSPCHNLLGVSLMAV